MTLKRLSTLAMSYIIVSAVNLTEYDYREDDVKPLIALFLTSH